MNYTVCGTATLREEYAGIPGIGSTKTCTFTAGSATATLTVDPTNGVAVEPDETVALMLLTGSGYAVGTTEPVVGIILNDDISDSYPVIETFGVTKLVKDGQNRLFTQIGNNTPVSIKLEGADCAMGL